MDIADLKEILRILEEQDITEFELEQDGVKLRVCRASASASAAPAPAVAYLAAPAARRAGRPLPPAVAAARARGGRGAGRERDRGEEPDRRHLLPLARPERPGLRERGRPASRWARSSASSRR